MRKMTKKLMYALGFVAMLLVGKDVNATTQTQPLTANVSITDRLTKEDSEKYYTYTVPEEGYFQFSLEKVAPLDSQDHYYNVYVYDKNANKIDSYEHYAGVTTQIYNFQKGDTITFKVVRHCSSCHVFDVDYRVVVDSTPSKEWEQEKGDSMFDATVLKSGNWVNGTIWTGGDVDYYKFVMDKNGYFDFQLRKVDPLASQGEKYNIYVYDKDGTRIDSAEGMVEWKSKKYNFNKGKEVYLKVVRHCSSCRVIGVNYQVMAQSKTDSSWEIEKGDKITNSTSLKSGKAMKASIWTGNDVDYFKFKAPSTGYYYLDLKKTDALATPDEFYNVEVLDSKGNKLTKYDHVTYLEKVKHYVKKDTTVVFKVYRHCSSCDVIGVDYSIKVTHKTKAVDSMAKTTLSYKSSDRVLKWKKGKSVDGYEVSVSKSSKFKKSATKIVSVESNSVTLSGYDYGFGKMYVKVTPYNNTINGKRIYGKPSKVKSIVIK